MNDPAIERKLERWMPKIIGGSKRALNSLMKDAWMLTLLARIAEWAERRKKIAIDEERGTDIREIITARIRDKLHKITNPNGAPWSMVVPKWCYVVGGRRCEDVRKKNARFVGGYDVRMFEPVSTLPSPEEELERKEQAPLRERVVSKIHETVFKVFKAATPEQRRILTLWAEGRTLAEIAEAMDTSTSNVQRKLKELQKAIVASVLDGIIAEVGDAMGTESLVAEVLEEVVNERDDLRGLLANSLKAMRGRARGPRLHV